MTHPVIHVGWGPRMRDEEEHFLVMLGDVANAASLGGFMVEVRLSDGSRHAGRVTHVRPDPGAGQLDDTGHSRMLHIDDALVQLDAVVAITIQVPSVSGAG